MGATQEIAKQKTRVYDRSLEAIENLYHMLYGTRHANELAHD